jgi:2-keto-4-pentenoate hydratase
MSGFIIDKHEGRDAPAKMVCRKFHRRNAESHRFGSGNALAKNPLRAIAVLQQPLTANGVYSMNRFCRSWNQKYRQQYKS